MDKIYTPKQDYKVLVRCFTYNQSNYIEDALNGFAMQKTNFPFACLVMDDCSTDGEQEIINVWMERECDMSKAEFVELELSNVVLVPHKANENCSFAFYFLKQNLYGTGDKKMKHVKPWRDHCLYEALCEGDDYWIAEDKLQKQVELLDTNPNISMVFHRAKILLEIYTTPKLNCFSIEDKEYSATELFENWLVPTASICYRINCLNYPIKNEHKKLNGDIFIVEECAHTGRVIGMSDFMSVYRMQDGGVTYDRSLNRKRALKYIEHYECISENFPKIDRNAIGIRLQEAYWGRIRYQNNILNKIKDFYTGCRCASFFSSSKQLARLIVDKISRLLG